MAEEKDDIVSQEIVSAARNLMQQYGLKKTTMEDIAKATGKGKSTLYYYFKDKEEIFDRVINLEIDELFQTVKTAVNKQSDVVNMLKAYIVTKIKTIKDKLNLYKFAIENDMEGRINKELTNLRNRYDNEEKKLISSILNKGIETKVFRNEIASEVNTLSDIFVSCVRGIELDIVTQNKFKGLAEKADMLVDIMTKGIGK